MTYEVLYDSILSTELHVLVHDVTDFPLIIRDPMITELHELVDNDTNSTLIDNTSERNLKIKPSQAQASDWLWVTSKGELRFMGTVNKTFTPFEMDLWLTT